LLYRKFLGFTVAMYRVIELELLIKDVILEAIKDDI